jgi:hypothetical protein
MSGNKSQNQHAIFERGELLPPEIITGTSWHKRLVDDDSIFTTVVDNEEFEAGARNIWHSHPGGQILIITDGVGYHQIKGEPIQIDILALVMLANKLRLAYPIVLVLGGLALSFTAQFSNITIDPELVFFIFLPPLLYEAAWQISWKELWKYLALIDLEEFKIREKQT